jgi:hypothetical protein
MPKMTTIINSFKGLKDSECKKGQLSSWPPIPYVPHTDLVTMKESSDNLKVKLEDGTVFTMTIFSQVNTKEYIAHIVAVLHLINQKGLDVQCRKLAKLLDNLAGTLVHFQKSFGPKGLSSKEDLEACKVEVIQTQEMLEEAPKTHNKAMAKTYELLRKLLSGDPQTQ